MSWLGEKMMDSVMMLIGGSELEEREAGRDERIALRYESTRGGGDMLHDLYLC